MARHGMDTRCIDRFADTPPGDFMKVLVAYMTSTGNTKKIADAIYSQIGCEKEIKPISQVEDTSGYDLAFLGFPTHGYGPDKKTAQILNKLCTGGRNVSLFVTHGAPENEPEVAEWMAKFKKEAAGSNLVSFFDCQGEMATSTRFFMLFMGKKAREERRKDNSKGQPDESRVEKARVFARETMSAISKGK